MNNKAEIRSLLENFVGLINKSVLKEDASQAQQAGTTAEFMKTKISDDLVKLGDEWVKKVLIKGSDARLDYSFIDDTDIRGNENWDKTIRNTPKSDTYDYILERLYQIYHTPDGEQTYLGFPVTPGMKNNISEGMKTMFNTFDKNMVFAHFIYGSPYASAPRPPRPYRDGVFDLEAMKDVMAGIAEWLTAGKMEYLLNYPKTNKFSGLVLTSIRNKMISDYTSKKNNMGMTGMRGAKNVTSMSLDAPMGSEEGMSKTFADTIESDLEINLDFATDSPTADVDIKDTAFEIVKQLWEWVMLKATPANQDLFKGIVLNGKTPDEILKNPEEYPHAFQAYGSRPDGHRQANRDFNSFVGGDKFNTKRKELVQKYASHLNGEMEQKDKINVSGMYGRGEKTQRSATADYQTDPEDAWAAIENGRLEENVKFRLFERVLDKEVGKMLKMNENFEPYAGKQAPKSVFSKEEVKRLLQQQIDLVAITLGMNSKFREGEVKDELKQWARRTPLVVNEEKKKLNESSHILPKQELLSLEEKYPDLVKILQLKKIPMAGYIGKIKIDGQTYDFDVSDNLGDWEYFIIGYQTSDSSEDADGRTGFKGTILDVEEDLVKALGGLDETELNEGPEEDTLVKKYVDDMIKIHKDYKTIHKNISSNLVNSEYGRTSNSFINKVWAELNKRFSS